MNVTGGRVLHKDLALQNFAFACAPGGDSLHPPVGAAHL
jgi:hypothetical protein